MSKAKLFFVIIFTCLLVCSSADLALASTDASSTTWTTAASNTNNDLMAVTYGNGIFLAVGNNGTILTSADGSKWTQQTLPYSPISLNTVMLNSVAFGNNMFVAVGDKTILTSVDGVNWTPINYVTYAGNPAYYIQAWLTNVTYTNSTFIVLGKSGTIITSADGVNWTQQSVNSASQLNSVTSCNNTLVAVGNSGTILQQEAPVPISSVKASNGTLTVVLSSLPATTPTLSQFTVEQSINGASPTTIKPTALTINGAMINLTIPLVSPTAATQKVIVSVSFNGGSFVASPYFTVSASSTGLLPSIPVGTIIFGNGQALEFAYANDPSHLAEVTADVISSSGKVYTITFSGSIIDNSTGTTLSLSQIALLPAVTYKDSKGDVWQFSAGNGPQIGAAQNDSITATVTQESFGSKVTISLINTTDFPGAAKYQVFQYDGLTSISTVTAVGQPTTVYPSVQVGDRVVIKFYQDDGTTNVGTPQTVTLTAG